MTEVNGIAGDHLMSFITRIETLEAEKKSISEDVKEVKAECKGAGFDIKIVNQLIKKRKIEAHDLAEQEEIEALYRVAIGMD